MQQALVFLLVFIAVWHVMGQFFFKPFFFKGQRVAQSAALGQVKPNACGSCAERCLGCGIKKSAR